MRHGITCSAWQCQEKLLKVKFKSFDNGRRLMILVFAENTLFLMIQSLLCQGHHCVSHEIIDLTILIVYIFFTFLLTLSGVEMYDFSTN